MESKQGVMNIIQEFSIPLIAGVVCAIIFANVDFHLYHELVDYHLFAKVQEILVDFDSSHHELFAMSPLWDHSVG